MGGLLLNSLAGYQTKGGFVPPFVGVGSWHYFLNTVGTEQIAPVGNVQVGDLLCVFGFQAGSFGVGAAGWNLYNAPHAGLFYRTADGTSADIFTVPAGQFLIGLQPATFRTPFTRLIAPRGAGCGAGNIFNTGASIVTGGASGQQSLLLYAAGRRTQNRTIPCTNLVGNWGAAGMNTGGASAIQYDGASNDESMGTWGWLYAPAANTIGFNQTITPTTISPGDMCGAAIDFHQ